MPSGLCFHRGYNYRLLYTGNIREALYVRSHSPIDAAFLRVGCCCGMFETIDSLIGIEKHKQKQTKVEVSFIRKDATDSQHRRESRS